MRKILIAIVCCACFIGPNKIQAQTSVISAAFNEYSLSAGSLSQITISSSNKGKIRLEAEVTNSANVVLLKLISEPLTVNTGINLFGSHNLKFSNVIYSESPQGDYIKTMKQLPSGIFNYCINVIPLFGIEEVDGYCQDIDVIDKDQLYLVNPIDEDELETTTPILMWFHTEPFNVLGPGESFRLILVELDDDQDAGYGISMNTPIFMYNKVHKHQQQYPLDAKKLEAGKRYGWQIQKISNGGIILTTEAWEFSIAKKEKPKDHRYVVMREKLDGSVYHVKNERIYFRFDERYSAETINIKIINDSREVIKPDLENLQKEEQGAKSSGYNSYELDLKPYHLKSGYYYLEIINEKSKKHTLKFYVE